MIKKEFNSRLAKTIEKRLVKINAIDATMENEVEYIINYLQRFNSEIFEINCISTTISAMLRPNFDRLEYTHTNQ